MTHFSKAVTALALFIISFYLGVNVALAQSPACQACLQAGNTPAECGAVCGGVNGGFDDPDDAIQPVNPLTEETLNQLNPLQMAGGDTIDDEQASAYADQLSTPGGIISRLLQFIFPLAGLILFLIIVWGGFEILIGAADKNSMQAGRNRITAGIVGFLILFASYWLAQIVEVVFGIIIL